VNGYDTLDVLCYVHRRFCCISNNKIPQSADPFVAETRHNAIHVIATFGESGCKVKNARTFPKPRKRQVVLKKIIQKLFSASKLSLKYIVSELKTVQQSIATPLTCNCRSARTLSLPVCRWVGSWRDRPPAKTNKRLKLKRNEKKKRFNRARKLRRSG